MQRVTIHEAKTHLSRLVAAAERGEQIVISRASKPVACLVALEAGSERNVAAKRDCFGVDTSGWTVPDDFDAPLPDESLDRFT